MKTTQLRRRTECLTLNSTAGYRCVGGGDEDHVGDHPLDLRLLQPIHGDDPVVQNGWFLIQDTSWPGYEEVPKWIIQGYTTMVYEAGQRARPGP